MRVIDVVETVKDLESQVTDLIQSIAKLRGGLDRGKTSWLNDVKQDARPSVQLLVAEYERVSKTLDEYNKLFVKFISVNESNSHGICEFSPNENVEDDLSSRYSMIFDPAEMRILWDLVYEKLGKESSLFGQFEDLRPAGGFPK